MRILLSRMFRLFPIPDDLFEYDLMLPAIAEIVEVDHRVALSAEQVRKVGLTFVRQFKFAKLVKFGDAPGLAAFLELVKMTVGPSHGDLESAVQATKSDRT